MIEAEPWAQALAVKAICTEAFSKEKSDDKRMKSFRGAFCIGTVRGACVSFRAGGFFWEGGDVGPSR